MRGGFSEITRKLIHVSMGLFALLLAYLTWWQALLFAGVALFHNMFVLPRYMRGRIFRGAAGEKGHDIGILLYPVSIAILILIFRNHLQIVAAAWGMLAFGDGFASIVGTLVGGPRLPWNREKSWSGTLAFCVFGFLGARFLWVFTEVGRFIGGLASIPSCAASLSAAADLIRQGVHVPDPAWLLTPAGFAGLARAAALDGWDTGIVFSIALVSILVAAVESMPIGVNDNISVPLVASGLFCCFALADPDSWTANAPLVLSLLPWAIGINVAIAAAAWAARSVSLSGVVGGILVGAAIFAFGGWRAFAVLAMFFVLGTVATKAGYARKAALGIAQEKGGRRGAKNAIANCGMGAILAVVAATSPFGSLAMLGLVAAFATAAADTVSSEIGQAWGRRTYLVTTFRPVPPGTEGAVSLEGTLAGIGASAVLALAAFALGLVTPAGAALVVVAAFFGSTLESYMGATWERAKLIDNEAINFANTLAGALFAIALAVSLRALPFLPSAADTRTLF